MKKVSEKDIFFMKKALSLARKGAGSVSPNPMVGAVLVKNWEIISSGYHKYPGYDHAEVIAIRKAGSKAKGSTLYINLEPCAHRGRTGPCCNVIKESGIKRVVAAMKDMNPLVDGKGFKKLKDSGIEVVEGVLQNEARSLNEIFFKYITTGLPFVVMKTASSLDGKIATAGGESKWITSAESRKIVHRLRSVLDAVLVGSNTILLDNPMLDCRLVKAKRNPAVIVIDGTLSIPIDSNVIRSARRRKVIIATVDNKSNRKKVPLYQNLGVDVIPLKNTGGKRIEFKKLMRVLGKKDITSILVEGGANVNASVIESGIVDKFYFFFAPLLLGGDKSKGMIGGDGVSRLMFAYNLEVERTKRAGKDILIVAKKAG